MRRGSPAYGSTGRNSFARDLPAQHTEQDTPVLSEARRWLDVYFTGREPDFLPVLHPIGSAFRRRVWDLLLRVPYGQTVTYGQLAQQLAAQQSLSHMSAQAVGGAVGHNAISIIIPLPPCGGHRRQSDGLRRRHRQKGAAADAGACRYVRLFRAEKEHRP